MFSNKFAALQIKKFCMALVYVYTIFHSILWDRWKKYTCLMYSGCIENSTLHDLAMVVV